MITGITGNERKVISEVAHDSMMLFFGHSVDIKRIAERLCYDDMAQAWIDIIEKGILELIKICEMDEDVCRQKEVNAMIPVKEVWRD